MAETEPPEGRGSEAPEGRGSEAPEGRGSEARRRMVSSEGRAWLLTPRAIGPWCPSHTFLPVTSHNGPLCSRGPDSYPRCELAKLYIIKLCVCVCVCSHLHIEVHTLSLSHKHAHTERHMYTHTHAHTHTCVRKRTHRRRHLALSHPHCVELWDVSFITACN